MRVGVPEKHLSATLARWKNWTPICSVGHADMWIPRWTLPGWTRSVHERRDTIRYSTKCLAFICWNTDTCQPCLPAAEQNRQIDKNTSDSSIVDFKW